jgi:hypothetical protein
MNSQKNIINSSFNKGMVIDVDPVVQPEGTYRLALNAVNKSYDEVFDGLTNEESTVFSFEVPGVVVGHTYIEARKKFLILSVDGNSSVIGWGDTRNNKYTEIARDTEFGCDWKFKECEWISLEYKFLQPCSELWVYWSSGCYYWRAPIDILENKKRRDELKCSDFELFQCTCAPNLTSFVSENGGYNLQNGIYQFSAQLEDNDGNLTNWFFVSEPVSIESEDNQPGERSTNSIIVSLENLDIKYNKVRIAVIKTIGGVTTAHIIGTKYYNSQGVSLVYTGSPEEIQDISLDEIINKSHQYLRGQDLIQKDNKLFIYNLRQINNLDYQRRANNISTRWVAYRVPWQDAKKFKSMMRDEVYAFGVVWNYCDGTQSPVYHIPAGNCNSQGKVCSSCNPTPLNTWSACSNGTGGSVEESVSINLGNIPGGGKGSKRSQSISERKGCKNAIPLEVDKGFTGSYLSEETYPLTKNCNGDYIYGSLAGQRIRHHHIPPTSVIPHFISTAEGVPNKYQMGNSEWLDTDVILLGMEFSGIQFPSEDELPKPLCPNNPYKIVYVERTEQNKSIIAKGLFINGFSGVINGKSYVFGKLGVNSPMHIDRMINNSISGEERKFGDRVSNPYAQLFYSPDTLMNKPPLAVDAIKGELELFGSGWKHGQYAKGKDPKSLYESRIDQRGTRNAVNLNHYVSKNYLKCISGITYADAHRIVTNPAGIALPLCNIYRESCVYLNVREDESAVPPFTEGVNDGYSDNSFNGDGHTHESPIPYAAAHYGSLKRSIPNQYGSVVNLNYIDLGLHSGPSNKGFISGPCGDSYVGLFSIVRKSYVSNKVSEHVEAGKEPDPPYTGLMKYLGMTDCRELPQPGHYLDARNAANLHPLQFKPWVTKTDIPEPTSDVYYPRVQKTLVSFWVESDVNPWLRGTGEKELGEIFYPKLKGMEIDSEVPGKSDWENSYLNRFYCEVRRLSKWKLLTLAAVRIFANLLPLSMLSTDVLDIESLPDVGTTSLEVLGTTLMWVVLNFFILNTENVKRLLGIEDCEPDRRDGKYDESIIGFEDNHYNYNWDHSRRNVISFNVGLSDPFNTCDCRDCCEYSTNEIYYSNSQIVDSPIDAYRNFQANSYVNMPAKAGRLVKIFIVNGQMYGHTSDGIYLIRYATQENSTLLENQLIGSASLLADPIRILEGVEEGIYGLRDPNASINTKFGYFFIDRDARTVYKFNGKIPEPITDINSGLGRLFYNHLPLCSEEECCEDEKRRVYYSLGYDPNYERILLTKKDEKSSWTISYDPEQKFWVSFHSYIPQSYMWDRDRMYSIYNNKVWIHNDAVGDYCKFYDEQYPFMVEFILRQETLQPFQFDSIMLDSQADIRDGEVWVKDRNITFNKAAFFNNTQSTGTLNLQVRDDYRTQLEDNLLSKIKDGGSNIEVVREFRQWRINELYDFVNDNNKPLLTKEKCNPIHDINNSIIDSSVIQEQNYRNRVLLDRYLTCRFIFDNELVNSIRLNVRNCLAQIHQIIR